MSLPHLNHDDEDQAFADAVRGIVTSAMATVARAQGPDAAHLESDGLDAAAADFGLFDLPRASPAEGGATVLQLAIAATVLGATQAPVGFIPHAAALRLLQVAGGPKAVDAAAAGRLTFVAPGGSAAGQGRFGLRDGVVHGSSGLVACSPRTSHVALVTDAYEIAVVDLADERVTVQPVAAADEGRPLARLLVRGAPATVALGPDRAATDAAVDLAVLLHAADAYGAAKAMLDQAVAYLSDRVQFGQPVTAFQAVRHQLAEVVLDVEPSRAMVWYGAWAMEEGLPGTSRLAALTGLHVCDHALVAARRLLPLQGAIAFTWEHGAHRALKRIMHDREMGGGSEVLRRRSREPSR